MTTENLNKYKSFVIPAGKYYLCDPCYILEDADDWLAFLDACATEGSSSLSGHYEEIPGGTKILAFSTAHGDGGYQDQHGNSYGVDSGLLGLIPCSYSPDRTDIEKLGKQVEFLEETLCFTKDGILTFGNYIIDTEEQ
jgi:hypothetical protein